MAIAIHLPLSALALLQSAGDKVCSVFLLKCRSSHLIFSCSRCSNGKIKKYERSSHCGLALTNPTSIYEDMGSIPGFVQWVKDLALL